MKNVTVTISKKPVVISVSGGRGVSGIGAPSAIHAAEVVTTPPDDSEIPVMVNTESSFSLRKVTFGSLKTLVESWASTVLTGVSLTWDSISGKPVFGGASLLDVGTISGTVAAGNDSRIVGALAASTAANTYQPLAAALTDTTAAFTTAQASKLSGAASLASPTFTGTVGGITSSMVGLGNVNNTSDANKPVSTAQQTALNLKANLISPSFITPNIGVATATSVNGADLTLDGELNLEVGHQNQAWQGNSVAVGLDNESFAATAVGKGNMAIQAGSVAVGDNNYAAFLGPYVIGDAPVALGVNNSADNGLLWRLVQRTKFMATYRQQLGLETSHQAVAPPRLASTTPHRVATSPQQLATTTLHRGATAPLRSGAIIPHRVATPLRSGAVIPHRATSPQQLASTTLHRGATPPLRSGAVIPHRVATPLRSGAVIPHRETLHQL